MTAFVDTLCDLLVAALQAKDIVTDWGYGSNIEFSAESLPDFSLIEATNTTQVRISGYPNVDLKKEDRGGVRAAGALISGEIKIGIGIVRKVSYTNGKVDEDEFRALKGLAESIYMWVWNALDTYEHKVKRVEFAAWYDYDKAKDGIFLTTINPVYKLGFEL